MTNHVVIFKRTELIYVYDSDDERVRARRKRIKQRKKRKKPIPVKKIFCNDCGEYFNSNDKGFIKYTEHVHICRECVEEAEELIYDEENTETTPHTRNNNTIIENPPILIETLEKNTPILIETLEKYILEHNGILDKIL
jgi:hypothetical protein